MIEPFKNSSETNFHFCFFFRMVISLIKYNFFQSLKKFTLDVKATLQFRNFKVALGFVTCSKDMGEGFLGSP